MKKSKLAFILAIIAALLCFTSFVIKLVRSDKIDYPILLAGVFILAFGISTSLKKTG
jgi:membrane protein CcdC involved in cytochrome C biogenesis